MLFFYNKKSLRPRKKNKYYKHTTLWVVIPEISSSNKLLMNSRAASKTIYLRSKVQLTLARESTHLFDSLDECTKFATSLSLIKHQICLIKSKQ